MPADPALERRDGFLCCSRYFETEICHWIGLLLGCSCARPLRGQSCPLWTRMYVWCSHRDLQVSPSALVSSPSRDPALTRNLASSPRPVSLLCARLHFILCPARRPHPAPLLLAPPGRKGGTWACCLPLFLCDSHAFSHGGDGSQGRLLHWQRLRLSGSSPRKPHLELRSPAPAAAQA